MHDHPILDNRGLSGRGSRVSESSDSSILHEDDTMVADESNRNNNNQTGSHHEGGDSGSMAVAGDQDNNPQVFKVYSGYGGSSYEYRAGYKTVSQIPDTAPGSAEQSSSVSVRGAAWTTTGRAASTVTEVLQSSTRASLTAPREEGECGREHEPDSTDWGPGQRKGWNISTQPIYRSPSSPCNRLFSAIKETRPGREPKALLERFAYTPQPTTPRNYQAAHLLRLGLESWNPSTAVTLYGTVTSPTQRQKAHSSSETSSVNSSSPARRQLQQQQKRKIIGHDPAPLKKAAGSAGKGNRGQQPQQQQQQQQQRGSKLPKAFKEWKISTTPQWKATFKSNQFENIKDKKRSPRVDNKYTGVKAQYRKPSKKVLRLRKERQLEAQRREDYQALDMKLRLPGRLDSHEG